MDNQIEQEISCILKSTKSGHITCQVTMREQNVLLHSAYDPVKEARQLVANHIENMKGKQRVIVYGLGCGYHVAELLKATEGSTVKKIEVWEFNTAFYEFIKEESIVEDVLQDSRVCVYVTDDKKEVLAKVLQFGSESDYIIMHQASVKLISDRLKDIKEIFQIFQLNVSNMLVARDKLNEHCAANIATGRIDRNNLFYNLMDNVPMVLVAAGPSLQKNIDFLKKYRKQIFIGAVGTALQPLLNNEIMPDFFMLTDSVETLWWQFATVPLSIQKKIPLFYLSTVMPSVVSQYAGSKIMLLQQGMIQAEELARELNIVAVQTGGSVATTLLDWMVQLGAKQICFVGQDLAYLNNQSHTLGSTSNLLVTENGLQSLMEIDDYFRQGKVRTPGNLYIYKKWIETYIWQHTNIQFFNATQGGAYIEGCQHVDFESFINKISFDGDIDIYKERFLQAIKKITER